MVERKLSLLGLALISLSAPKAFALWNPGDMLSVGTYGLSVHAFADDPIYTANMPRRLDDGAHFVRNPEIMFNYKEGGGSKNQYVASFGEDCFGHTEVYLSWGQHFRAFSFMSYGYVIGAYYRKTYLLHYNGQTQKLKEFYTLDVGNGNQFVPMPLVTMELSYPVSRSFDLSFLVGSNIYLTHMTAALRYRFGVEDKTTPIADDKTLARVP